jgi:hypothetical protein
VNRASKIRKMTICGSLRLLVVLTGLASLGISPLDPEAQSGGYSEVLALVDHAPEDGREAVAIGRRRVSEQECGPTITCLPVLLHAGDMLNVLNLGPDRDIDLPRLTVDLWHILPTAPVPIV